MESGLAVGVALETEAVSGTSEEATATDVGDPAPASIAAPTGGLSRCFWVKA